MEIHAVFSNANSATLMVGLLVKDKDIWWRCVDWYSMNYKKVEEFTSYGLPYMGEGRRVEPPYYGQNIAFFDEEKFSVAMDKLWEKS